MLVVCVQIDMLESVGERECLRAKYVVPDLQSRSSYINLHSSQAIPPA